MALKHLDDVADLFDRLRYSAAGKIGTDWLSWYRNQTRPELKDAFSERALNRLWPFKTLSNLLYNVDKHNEKPWEGLKTQFRMESRIGRQT